MSTPLRSPGGGPPRVRGGEEPDCFCLCFRCVCKRCLTHCWFLFACLGFLFISSLPRISVAIDLVTTVLMYFIDVRKAEGFDSVGELIKRDVTEYNFRTSAFSVVILSVIRTVVLFYCFAYRFHMNDLTFLIATCTTVTSAVYVGIKLVVVDNNAIMPLCIFSFVMILAEYFIYMLVRRQRILGPRSAEEQRLLAGNRAESYQSLPDQHEVNVPVQPPPQIEEGLNPEQLADPDSRFILIDRIKVHFKVDGPQNKGTPLILIHGFGGSVFSWKQCWRQLSENHLVIAFDRPGFGLTSRPVNGDWTENPYTSEYQVGLLFRILDQLNLPQVILVGHSSGGALAMMAALARPERVRAMVLISPTVYTEGFPTLVRSLFRTRLGKELVRQLVRTEIGEVALRRAWHHPSNIPEEVLHHYKQTLKVTAWHEALMEMTNAPPPKFAHRIGEIRCPVLVVHGVDDKLVALSESKKVVAELAGATYHQLVSVDECGHVPHEELPAAFVDYVEDFLRNHVPGAAGNHDEPDQKE